MKARLLKTDGPALEATLEIDGREYCVMDQFSWSEESAPRIGDTFEVELSGLLDDSWPWETIFAANPDRNTGLEHLGGWSYLARGRVTSVNPVRVDCGILTVEDPVVSHDTRVIGEFIGFRIERLDAAG
jgi:hypothetical protein